MINVNAIYQTKQIRALEKLAIEKFNLSEKVLMQRAGNAAFEYLKKRWPNAQKIAVICGAGNNGGDGYVVALLAHKHDLNVIIYQIGDHSKQPPIAKEMMEACKHANIRIVTFENQTALHEVDLIVDAICGIGLHETLRDPLPFLINKITESNRPVLAIDIPTGINADTGEVLGVAIRASATITFIGQKLGLLTGAAVDYTGDIEVSDLQLSSEILISVTPPLQRITLLPFIQYLKPRLPSWHKGLSGHVLVVGGEAGFSGAACMAAISALRTGAGLVSIATRPQHAALLSVKAPVIMSHGVDEPDELEPLIQKADFIVLGPGLGQSDWAKALWKKVLTSKKRMLLDADALNLLSHEPLTHHDWILTAHAGEAARLLNTTPQIIQNNRLEAIQTIQKQYGGVVVLKGPGTLVINENTHAMLCDKGNPGMATAGMGDVLSGVVGSLAAQHLSLFEAAQLGVLLHAMAGDYAAHAEGEKGMLATDLYPYLRKLVNDEGK